MFVRSTGGSWGGRVDGYCNRLSPASKWALRSLWSLQWLRKKKFSDLSNNDRWDRTFYISAIVVAAIAEVFLFSSVIAAITAMVRIIWKACFNLIVAYYKRKDFLQRNVYLNCVSLWKSLEGWWYLMVRLNKCSSLVECVDFSNLSGATVGCL